MWRGERDSSRGPERNFQRGIDTFSAMLNILSPPSMCDTFLGFGTRWVRILENMETWGLESEIKVL